MAHLAVFVISVLVGSEISSEDVAFSVEERIWAGNQLMGKRLCAKLHHSTGYILDIFCCVWKDSSTHTVNIGVPKAREL